MDTNLLDIKFARMGARLKIADRLPGRTRTAGVISLDVQTDRKGEFFEITQQPGVDVEVAVLSCSLRTVKRRWQEARILLQRAIESGESQ